MNAFELRMGPFSPPIDRQLHEQGIELDAGDVEHWERDVTAVNRLGVRGALTMTEVKRARRRIFKQIQKAVAATGGGS